MASIKERMEALKVAQGGDGGELALGGGGVSATATPVAAAGASSGAPARLGEVVSESVSVAPRKYGTSDDPPPAPAADAAGEVRKSGLLSKKHKVRPIFEKCWVTLHAAPPSLAFHIDERKKEEKSDPLPLAGATVRREDDCVLVSTPEEEIEGLGQFQGKRMNVTKLQAESAPAADEWRQAIEDAINA